MAGAQNRASQHVRTCRAVCACPAMSSRPQQRSTTVPLRSGLPGTERSDRPMPSQVLPYPFLRALSSVRSRSIVTRPIRPVDDPRTLCFARRGWPFAQFLKRFPGKICVYPDDIIGCHGVERTRKLCSAQQRSITRSRIHCFHRRMQSFTMQQRLTLLLTCSPNVRL